MQTTERGLHIDIKYEEKKKEKKKKNTSFPTLFLLPNLHSGLPDWGPDFFVLLFTPPPPVGLHSVLHGSPFIVQYVSFHSLRWGSTTAAECDSKYLVKFTTEAIFESKAAENY